MKQTWNLCQSRKIYNNINEYLKKKPTALSDSISHWKPVCVWVRLHVCLQYIVRDWGKKSAEAEKKRALKIVLQYVLWLPAAFNNHCWHQRGISQHGQLWSARCQEVYLQNLHAAPPLRSCTWARTARPESAHDGAVLCFLPKATVQQSPH